MTLEYISNLKRLLRKREDAEAVLSSAMREYLSVLKRNATITRWTGIA